MKSLMSNWRCFLLEADARYSGIIKITPSPRVFAEVKKLQKQIEDPEAVNIPEEHIHVTAIHQSILKPFKKQIKKMILPEAPDPILDIENGIQVRQNDDKKSWAVRLKNQEEMREYVKNIMEMLGSDDINPEPERIFHISLANLTGNPHDSVR